MTKYTADVNDVLPPKSKKNAIVHKITHTRIVHLWYTNFVSLGER